MKCPACGFETSADQAWCDFCKEPFNKPAKQPLSAKVAPVASVPAASEAKGPTLVPPDFTGMDTGGSLPQVPPNIRWLAWAFLVICVLGLLAAWALLLHRAGMAER